MRGPKPKYLIQLLDNQIAELRQLINSRKAPQGKVMRARVILAAHEHPEWSNQEIARQVGCTDRAVRKWRHRWVETKSLEDLPRSGAPKRFSPRSSS
jgi:transposase